MRIASHRAECDRHPVRREMTNDSAPWPVLGGRLSLTQKQGTFCVRNPTPRRSASADCKVLDRLRSQAPEPHGRNLFGQHLRPADQAGVRASRQAAETERGAAPPPRPLIGNSRVLEVELLDATHDRRAFDCGVEPLNRSPDRTCAPVRTGDGSAFFPGTGLANRGLLRTDRENPSAAQPLQTAMAMERRADPTGRRQEGESDEDQLPGGDGDPEIHGRRSPVALVEDDASDVVPRGRSMGKSSRATPMRLSAMP